MATGTLAAQSVSVSYLGGIAEDMEAAQQHEKHTQQDCDLDAQVLTYGTTLYPQSDLRHFLPLLAKLEAG